MSSTRHRPNRVRLSLDVPADLKVLLDRIKALESRSYTEIVRRALERYGHRCTLVVDESKVNPNSIFAP